MDSDAPSPTVAEPTAKPKRKRRSISLVTKEEIIKDCELALQEKFSFRKLAKKWDMNPQTISHIWKHREKILGHLTANPATSATIITNNKRVPPLPSLEAMENVLISWIDEQTARGIELTKADLCEKAKSMVEYYDEKFKPEKPTDFQASPGWLRSFHRRFEFKQKLADLLVKKDKADDKRTLKFVSNFEETICEGNYRPEQIFAVDEIGFYWKINGKHQQRVTMLIGGNASGDFKLKPMLINSSEAPRALLHVNRNTLPVIYRANKSLCMTLNMFTKWFRKHFLVQVREYLQSKGIEYKVLLVVDSVPAHTKKLGCGSGCEKVKLVFIPPLVSCKIQPMANEDLVEALRVFYLQRTMKMAEEHIKNGNVKREMTDFWKNYNIRQCIDNVGLVWNEEISQATMLNAWKKLYPSNPATVIAEATERSTELSGELAEQFTPLLNTITEDLIDFTELNQDQIVQYLRECSQLWDRKIDTESPSLFFAGDFDLSSSSTSEVPPCPSIQSTSLQPSILQPSTSSSSKPPVVKQNVASAGTSSGGLSSTLRLPTPINRKRPLLQQALLNGSKLVKANTCNGVLPNGQPHQQRPTGSPISSSTNVKNSKFTGLPLAPVSTNMEALQGLYKTVEVMIGRDRALLLMRVLSLPDSKVSMARQLLKILDCAEQGGTTLTLQNVEENQELLTILRQNFYRLKQAPVPSAPPAKPISYPQPTANGGTIPHYPPMLKYPPLPQ